MTKETALQMINEIKARHKITDIKMAHLLAIGESTIRRWRLKEYNVPDWVENNLDMFNRLSLKKQKELIKERAK